MPKVIQPLNPSIQPEPSAETTTNTSVCPAAATSSDLTESTAVRDSTATIGVPDCNLTT